ncbi:helix-turn-helix domain-containing protein [Planktotalea sp.]|uniref:helix-turn-helix domain-containing protein n=1 Tax=Planktotalea sp. TaxID=2029877 RepID=UPI003F6D374A
MAQCILGGFVRDTRGCGLPAEQRFNHFASVPLCALSLMFDGTTRMMQSAAHYVTPKHAPQMPRMLFSGAQSHPTSSWNEGDIQGLIIAFYPDALSALLGLPMEQFHDKSVRLSALPDSAVRDVIERAFQTGVAKRAFEMVQEGVAPIWQDVRPSQSPFGRMISDWSRSLMLNAALSPSGRSLRQIQRRVKAATGVPLKRLQTYSKAEEAFALALRNGSDDLAGIAADAGYSDQSHMGRQVRAQTGFTPTQLMRGFESDEAFWSYRLMGERY